MASPKPTVLIGRLQTSTGDRCRVTWCCCHTVIGRSGSSLRFWVRFVWKTRGALSCASWACTWVRPQAWALAVRAPAAALAAWFPQRPVTTATTWKGNEWKCSRDRLESPLEMAPKCCKTHCSTSLAMPTATGEATPTSGHDKSEWGPPTERDRKSSSCSFSPRDDTSGKTWKIEK